VSEKGESGTAISARLREQSFDELETRRFDCAIIGGGITGAGIAREATLRGLSVALIEAEDFASGTSSRSSKLIHGGLRYLAQGEVKLVRETALERKRVHRMAPHLAEPAWMVVPVHSRAGLLKFRAAIGAYEKLGAVADADRHRNWTGEELAREEPALDRKRYPFACAYREYVTDDARLVLANLRAAVGRGAVAINHASVRELVCESGAATGVVAECGLTGRRVRVRAATIVNAAGPWVEAVRRLEDPAAKSVLHLSKGVHVVVPQEKLPVRNLLILTASDRRSVFAIPRGDVVYLGTTDTSYSAAATLWPAIDLSDVAYLLEPLTRYLSTGPLSPNDCVGAWAGLRPLVAQKGKAAVEISRRDEIWIGPAGVVTVAGGKLTGYRRMANDVVDRVFVLMGRTATLPASDEDEVLPGGAFSGDLATLAAELAANPKIHQSAAERLARLYGAEAHEVLALGSEAVVSGGSLLRGEVEWAVEREGAARLEDVLYRRTRVALYGAALREPLVQPVADLMALRLGWDEARSSLEVARVRKQLRADLSFNDDKDAASGVH